MKRRRLGKAWEQLQRIPLSPEIKIGGGRRRVNEEEVLGIYMNLKKIWGKNRKSEKISDGRKRICLD